MPSKFKGEKWMKTAKLNPMPTLIGVMICYVIFVAIIAAVSPSYETYQRIDLLLSTHFGGV
jgi:hypothetical protein